KSVLGFRQFMLRGLENVKGEWNLVALGWNLKRMFNLKYVTLALSGGSRKKNEKFMMRK
ncbi:MAG: transposase, partial [Candidatus Nitrotoga sp.]